MIRIVSSVLLLALTLTALASTEGAVVFDFENLPLTQVSKYFEIGGIKCKAVRWLAHPGYCDAPVHGLTCTGSSEYSWLLLRSFRANARCFGAKIMTERDSKDPIIGLLYGVRSSEDFYSVELDCKKGQVAVYHYSDGKRESLTVGKISPCVGKWLKLRTEYNPASIKVWVDGQLSISFSYQGDLTRTKETGQIGFYTRGNCEANIDYFFDGSSHCENSLTL